jgi:hypothetical protein
MSKEVTASQLREWGTRPWIKADIIELRHYLLTQAEKKDSTPPAEGELAQAIARVRGFMAAECAVLENSDLRLILAAAERGMELDRFDRRAADTYVALAHEKQRAEKMAEAGDMMVALLMLAHYECLRTRTGDTCPGGPCAIQRALSGWSEALTPEGETHD